MPVFMTKIDAPPTGAEAIPRERLLSRLRSGADARLTLVAAPAGSGKSTLLAQWSEAQDLRGRAAWLTVSEVDNDPVVLWSHLLEALKGACPNVSEFAVPGLVGKSLVDVVVPTVINALRQQERVVLIIDDFHRLSAGPARDSIALLVKYAPSSLQVVISTRTEPPLDVAALRAHGDLVEIRSDDLRFTTDEATAFLNGRSELGLSRADVEALVARTAGLPAGIYLAALSLVDADDRHGFVARLEGTSRHTFEFLADEALASHSVSMQELMLRCSPLERFSGPLCDFVLERESCQAVLGELSRANLFLIPLDDGHSWYRFHHLFAQFLQMELERREPGAVAELRRRASTWYAENGMVDEAIEHALAGGAYPEAGEMIATVWVQCFQSFKIATILSWLERFPAAALRADVRLLLVKAWVLALSGRHMEAEELTAEIEQGVPPADAPLPDGFASVASSLALLKAGFPRGDVGKQIAAAEFAAELEGPASPWRAAVCWTVGAGQYYKGELDNAERWFSESATLALLSEQYVVAMASLIFRSFIAGDQGRIEEQRLLSERAAEFVRAHGMEGTSGMAHVALGTSLAVRGRLDEALPLVDRGVVDVRKYRGPIELAEALLRQLSLLQRLGDRDRAAAVLAEVRGVLDSCPDPGALPERLADLERQTHKRPSTRDDELTERERVVLRLLSGTLSESDIARELYVSRNTVHSQVRSIYRKLGVSSRGAAIDTARTLDLL